MKEIIAIRNQHSALSCSKRLRTVKTENANVAEAARLSAFMFGASSFRGVLDHRDIIFGRDFQNLIHLRYVSIEVDGNYGLCFRCDAVRERFRGQTPGRG